MKKLLLILAFLLLATPAFGATNWFAGSGDTDFNAVSGGTTSSVWNTNADGTSGTYLDWSTQPANGDVFIANGATLAIDANIGSGSVTVTLTTEGTDYGGTDGGGFTVNINTTDPLTLYTNIVAGSTDCLTISGAGAGVGETELTIIGNATAGGSAADGIYSTHTAGHVVMTGNASASASTNSSGVNVNTTSGVMTITGNATGVGSYGFKIGTTTAGSYGTIVGNCIGSDTTYLAEGCMGQNVVGLIVKGNIINGARSNGTSGNIVWSPQATSHPFNYVKILGDGTPAAYYLVAIPDGSAHPPESDVENAVEYGFDGADHYTGTLSAGGGGGAWGF